MLTEISLEIILFLAAIALVAGFVDAVAGGGGLLTIPALLLVQIPPVHALATNKLQGSFGTLSASITMLKKGKVKLPMLWSSIFPCFIGATAGTVALQISPPKSLEVIIPIVISIVCIYFIIPKKKSDVKPKPRVSKRNWRRFYVPSLGFYDGYLGPGAGMFYTLGEVSLRGKEIISATANAKVLNFTSNIASLFIFVIGGKVLWLVGGCMIVGQIIGAVIGANMAIKNGDKFIRPMIVVMCLCMLLKFVFS